MTSFSRKDLQRSSAIQRMHGCRAGLEPSWRGTRLLVPIIGDALREPCLDERQAELLEPRKRLLPLAGLQYRGADVR